MAFFISVEGGEGTGKTTQIALLAQAFSAAKLPLISTREPGGTGQAEQIRSLLVTGDAGRWDPVTETLLFYAARTHHVETVIKPALSGQTHVLCDRFMDSTLVYQGLGKRLGTAWIRRLHGLAVGALIPDLTLMLDIDPQIGLARAAKRKDGEDRFEHMQLAFHRQVRQGFLDIAKAESVRCAVIDAAQTVEQVHAAVIRAVQARLGLALAPVPVP